jgi:hypothetical protein
MTLEELKTEIKTYQYFEDTDIIDVALASIISTRLKLGNPIWLIIIGASSGGKSQILRPLALTDAKFMHRVDDLTENTFLSGISGDDSSLLKRIGKNGMIGGQVGFAGHITVGNFVMIDIIIEILIFYSLYFLRSFL